MNGEERGSDGLAFVARTVFLVDVAAGFQGVMVRCVMAFGESVKSKNRWKGSVMP